MAICLPGIASSENRAETSAMRVEPFEITTKLMITRIANTMMPITKLPEAMNRENPSITPPAARVPVWPSDRISRVDATLSESRSIVTTRSSVGKLLKSTGRGTHSATIRMSAESESDTASPTSSRIGGSGTNSTASTIATPMAKATSRLAPSRKSSRPALEEVSLIPVPLSRTRSAAGGARGRASRRGCAGPPQCPPIATPPRTRP